MTTFEMVLDIIKTVFVFGLVVFLIIKIGWDMGNMKERISKLEKKVNNDKD